MNAVPRATFLGACSTRYAITSLVLVYAFPSTTSVGSVAWGF